MKVTVLYHPLSDHASAVDVFRHDVMARYNSEVELLSVDTRPGAELAQVYGVTSYPAVLAVDDEGKLLNLWQGENLPLINDIAYYLQNSFSSHNL
jgi:thioredoxin-like negative regulator of GroEL